MPAPPTNVAVSPTPVDGVTIVSWQPSSDDNPSNFDSNGRPLGQAGGYYGDLSTDNGATWTPIFAGVTPGAYTYISPSAYPATAAVDCTSFAATTTGLVRVRFFDGISFSTNALTSVFTIQHSPRMLYPVGGETFAIGVPQTLRWAPASDPTTSQNLMTYHLQI